ncbi:MAG: hypothetical protein D6806_07135, partial [Deltaproteobacteria bacterium]
MEQKKVGRRPAAAGIAGRAKSGARKSARDDIDERTLYIAGTTKADASKRTIAQNLDDEQIARRIADAKQLFDHFNRALKNISIYRHNVARFKEYLAATYQHLKRILKNYGTIAFRVEQLGFKYFGQMVYEQDATEQNIAHKFYRSGVRILIFREGLDEDELLKFTEICLTNFHKAEYMFEDMVSLMWKAEFRNIEYVVVESFAVGTESQEEAKAEIDKIVNYLYRQLTSDDADGFKYARLSLEDLEIEMEGVEQAKGVVVKGEPATPSEKAAILQQLDEDDTTRALPKLVDILLNLFDEEIDPELSEALEDVFVQLLDSFLMHENFKGLNQMLRRLRNLARKNLPPNNLALVERLEQTMKIRMGEAERLNRVAEILDTAAEIKEPQEVFRYLSALDEQAIVPLLEALERMEKLEARRLICDALAQLGKDQLDVFVRRLQSDKANLVRDMVYVIDKIDPPDKLDHLSRLLKHPNLAIRLETLNTLGSSGDESCGKYVSHALQDGNAQMRMAAARLLLNFDVNKAARTLLKIVEDPSFEKRHPQEQTAFYTALAMTNTPDAMEFFKQQLRASSLIGKKKLAEHKQQLVDALARSGSIAAFKLLKGELEAGVKDQQLAG